MKGEARCLFRVSTTMESVESLSQKLLVTYGARHQLERLHQRAVPVVVRVIEAARVALPLGMIPLALVWTAVVFFLPIMEPLALIRLYAMGLLGLLLIAAAVVAFRALLSRVRLKDSILGEMATLQGLAFHPNTALRRQLAARGYATLGDFHQWYTKQCEILDQRAEDFEAAIEHAERGHTAPPNLDEFPPGARLFLER